MEGFEIHINHLMYLSEYLVAEINKRPEKFELLIKEPELVNVMFWYIPTRLRGVPHDKQWEKEIGVVS